MADVITRFKLETTQYDSKLRDAAKGLKEYTHQATMAGNEFAKFTQKNVEAARAFGTIATSATNSKDKVKELVGAFNDVAKAYNALTKEQQQSDFGKALAESMTTLKGRIAEAKQELYDLGNAAEKVKSGGGLFGGKSLTDMLSVAGGNLIASGISKLTSELTETVQQSIELARSGEGVRLAFERLNQPGLLANLKEATHGTVSELELMKAAVKFDDFKLPVEQLGTLLAFAQKKAKDTGQSVDYMVDSIVTGLGRKSLMILDNLGLSAAQIKERMAETGDMTTAVASIIKEQMSEAGEYVETAADRAARAAAEASDKMEKLGREAMPVAEEWASAWNEIKLGGMSVLTTVLGPIADSIKSIREILSGEFELKIKANIPNLAEGGQSPWANWKPGTDHTVQAPGGYVEVTDSNTGAVIGGSHFDNLNDTNSIKAWQKSLVKTTSTKSGSKTVKTEEQLNNEQIQKLTQEYLNASAQRQEAIRAEIKLLQDRNKEIQYLKDEAQGKIGKLTTPVPVGTMGPMMDVETKMNPVKGVLSINENPFEKYKDVVIELKTPLQALEEELKNIQALQAAAWSPEVFAAYQQRINEVQGKINEFKDGAGDGAKDTAKAWKSAASAISSVGNAMSGLKNPAIDIMTVIGQSIATIALAYAETLAKDRTSKSNIWSFIAAAAASTVSMAATIASIHSATGYAQGGEIKGNSYSGDNIGGLVDGSQLVGLNAGEIVLNQAGQRNVAAGLQGGVGGNLNLHGVIKGEDILITADRSARRQGKGELVFWR